MEGVWVSKWLWVVRAPTTGLNCGKNRKQPVAVLSYWDQIICYNSLPDL